MKKNTNPPTIGAIHPGTQDRTSYAPDPQGFQMTRPKPRRTKTARAEGDLAPLENSISDGVAPINEDNGAIHPRNTLNDLTAREWVPETVSVWVQRGLGANHPDAQIEKQHPAPFSFTDVSRLIRFFTKAGGTLLDPFAGVGSTLKACALEGRKGIGIELNPKYVELTKERLCSEVRDLFAKPTDQVLRTGDARKILQTLPTDSADFVVTSPPYWNILHKEDHKANQERKSRKLDTRYSGDDLDLGNMPDYDDFLHAVAEVLGACGRVLRPSKYMAVIVSDFRHKSRFVMFHADLANALRPYKLDLRGLSVLYQRHKRVFPYGYPYAYVPNVHHQFILILYNAK